MVFVSQKQASGTFVAQKQGSTTFVAQKQGSGTFVKQGSDIVHWDLVGINWDNGLTLWDTNCGLFRGQTQAGGTFIKQKQES